MDAEINDEKSKVVMGLEKIRATTAEEIQETVSESKEETSSFEMLRRKDSNAHLDRSPLHGLWALTNRELKKWYKTPLLLFMSLIQPIIWLGIFGKALNFGGLFSGTQLASFASGFVRSTFGTSDYFSFLAVGMLAFVVLFTSMFSGMSIVWDRRFGFLNKVLSTPVSRGAIVIGKVLSSVIRSLAQAGVVLVIAVLLGMNLSGLTAVGILGAFAALFLLSFGLSSLFVMLALRSSDWQSQMAIMNLLNLPLLFASNALFPSKFMPDWLQVVVKLNPISYATDAGRQLLLGSASSGSLGFDFLFLAGFAILFSAVGIVLSWKLLSK